MNGSIFVDTSLLVYAYDLSEPPKQERALTVLDALASAELGAVSTQVLSEFYVTVTGKIAKPLSLSDATSRIEHHLQIWTVLSISTLIVVEAIRGVRQHHFPFWNSQIWATARMNQVLTVFSEDFGDRTVVEGVRFVNPFAPEFRLAEHIPARLQS
jgi:predicted nucleic acid-binding protein